MDLAERLQAQLSVWIGDRATASHAAGLASSAARAQSALVDLGFEVRRHDHAGHAPVLVASRVGTGGCIGLSGHYDVEEAGDAWSVPAFELTCRQGRWFGRGTADNLGPLVLRLCTLAARTAPSPSLLWILQGEEEIGSPWAHQLFPQLVLPHVDLWLEETGYFEADGRQRMLLRRPSARVAPWIAAVEAVATSCARTVDRHDRYLNKAFGESRCPFLTHLVGATPYLAIGPNDTSSRIHSADESLPVGNLAVSAAQFDALLTAAACAESDYAEPQW